MENLVLFAFCFIFLECMPLYIEGAALSMPPREGKDDGARGRGQKKSASRRRAKR